MTELDLYKFVAESNIEYHWYDDKVRMFVPIYLIEEFNDLFDVNDFDDDNIECTMKQGYFGFDMTEICDYHGFDIEKIFTDKEK